MKFFVLSFCLFATLSVAHAQRIRVNGQVTTRTEKPIQGVLVMAFDKGTMIKSYVSSDKGEYSFYVDASVFDILFYKPGMYAHSYRLNNKLDRETQGINFNIYMDDSLAETAVNLAQWLKKHHVEASYLDSLYKEEIRKLPPPVAKRKSKKEVRQEAQAEQKRFANYRENTVRDTANQEQSEVTTIHVGMDVYERITSQKGDNKYFKNNKPITEVTYRFETTRRYDGVLKNTKNVRKFDKYRPMDHVKGS